MRLLSQQLSAAAYWLTAAVLLAAGVQARSIHHNRQVPQEPDFTWALTGYSEPNCKGDIVANWRGANDVPACIRITATRSISGGSGGANTVNLWKDRTCKVPADDVVAAGQDGNRWPCYNAVIQGFSVGDVVYGLSGNGNTTGAETMSRLDFTSV